MILLETIKPHPALASMVDNFHRLEEKERILGYASLSSQPPARMASCFYFPNRVGSSQTLGDFNSKFECILRNREDHSMRSKLVGARRQSIEHHVDSTFQRFISHGVATASCRLLSTLEVE